MVPWKLYDPTTKMCPYVSSYTVVFARHVVRSDTSLFFHPLKVKGMNAKAESRVLKS